ncbi:hypothetical protein ACFLVK_01720 [Chloroflexota bacterium]
MIRAVIEPATIDVDIDIKPCSDPNSVNPRSNGVLPVAILSTLDFDATTVDPTTVMLDGVSAIKSKVMDVCEEGYSEGDGDLDLVVYFNTPDFTGWDENTVEAILTGETLSGIPIEGMDSIRIVTKGPHN